MTAQQIKILIAGLLAMMTVAFATSSVTYFIIPVTEELEIGRGAFSLHYTIMALTSTLTFPFFSKIIERVGMRKVVFFSGIGLFIGFCIYASSQDIWQFYIGAFFIGLFYYASTTLVALTLINEWFTKKKGMVTGIVMAGSGIGGVLLGLIIPHVLTTVDWRLTYVFLGGLMLMTTIPSALFLINTSPKKQHQELEDLLQEEKPSNRILFFNKTFIISYLSICFFFLGVSSIQHLPSIIIEKGFTLTQAGYLLSILNFSMIFLKIIIGWVNDRLGVKTVLAYVCALYALGFTILLGEFEFFMMSICMCILAVGNSAATVIFPLFTTTLYNPKNFTIIWGVLGTASTIGNALGSTILGYVFDIFGSYNYVIMGLAIGILFVGAILRYFLKRKERLIYEDMQSMHQI